MQITREPVEKIDLVGVGGTRGQSGSAVAEHFRFGAEVPSAANGLSKRKGYMPWNRAACLVLEFVAVPAAISGVITCRPANAQAGLAVPSPSRTPTQTQIVSTASSAITNTIRAKILASASVKPAKDVAPLTGDTLTKFQRLVSNAIDANLAPTAAAAKAHVMNSIAQQTAQRAAQPPTSGNTGYNFSTSISTDLLNSVKNTLASIKSALTIQAQAAGNSDVQPALTAAANSLIPAGGSADDLAATVTAAATAAAEQAANNANVPTADPTTAVTGGATATAQASNSSPNGGGGIFGFRHSEKGYSLSASINLASPSTVSNSTPTTTSGTTSDQNTFGAALLNPSSDTRSMNFNYTTFFSPFRAKDRSNNPYFGLYTRLSLSEAEWQYTTVTTTAATSATPATSTSSTKQVDGFVFAPALGLQILSPEYQITPSETYQLVVGAGLTTRSIGGDVGQDSSFRSNMFGTMEKNFRSAEFSFQMVLNQFAPYVRLTNFGSGGSSSLYGFAGSQVTFGVDVTTDLFQLGN